MHDQDEFDYFLIIAAAVFHAQKMKHKHRRWDMRYNIKLVNTWNFLSLV